MSANEILGALATILGLISCGIYLWQVFRRTIRPHIFSWIIWSLLAFIGFTAQRVAHAGPGSWTTGFSAFGCFMVAALGLFYGEKSITRSDWTCFIFALFAIPAWIATHNPLWA